MWQRWNSATKIFEKSDDNGGSWTPLGLDAAIITQGILDAARLPTDVAYYEIGDWTPTITGSTSGSGQTYVLQTGKYIRINDFVLASCYVALTAKGIITGGVEIAGLPFVAINDSNIYWGAALGQWTGMAANFTQIWALMIPGSSRIALRGTYAATATNSNNLGSGDLNNNSTFLFTVAFIAEP